MKLFDGAEFHPDVFDGVPVLEGTGFTVAEILRALASGRSLNQIASDFDLGTWAIQRCLEGLAGSLEVPMRMAVED